MKLFLIKISLFSLLLFATILSVFFCADGYTDAFYVRFTTLKQTSLVLGTSRAAQGIQPQIINNILNRNDIFNYSFTIVHSPYGPTYLSSIKKKLDTNTSNGIFILTVDPWSISTRGDNPNDTKNFQENNLTLNKTKFVNMKPNVSYLINSYDHRYYNLLLKRQNSMFLHNNGWLEVTINMDSSQVEQRTKNKITEYKTNNVPFYKYSSVRLEFLIKTIDYLELFGKVYLVRLPIHPLMMELEEALMSNFDEIIERISDEKDIPYLNLTSRNEDYVFTDGNHLYNESGKKVTEEIAKWILNHLG